MQGDSQRVLKRREVDLNRRIEVDLGSAQNIS
jgi:hypothetical protein